MYFVINLIGFHIYRYHCQQIFDFMHIRKSIEVCEVNLEDVFDIDQMMSYGQYVIIIEFHIVSNIFKLQADFCWQIWIYVLLFCFIFQILCRTIQPLMICTVILTCMYLFAANTET